MTLVPSGTPGDQRARVYTEDIDDTSRDACFPLLYEVRLGDGSNSDWTEFVEFDCSDITPVDTDATIKLELRVTEDRNFNGQIESNEGSNVCWSYIRIEDKTPPQIAATNVTLDCDDTEINDLQLRPGRYAAGSDATDQYFPTIIGGCTNEGI
ncbi:MAG: hypothetical protein AB8G22_02510 [Saprospiraceae bacterium]